MPKLKTKSAAKKRFKVTATGKVLAQAAGALPDVLRRVAVPRGLSVLRDDRVSAEPRHASGAGAAFLAFCASSITPACASAGCSL